MCALPEFNIHHLFNTTVVSAKKTRNNKIFPNPGPGKASIAKPLRSHPFLSERLHDIPQVANKIRKNVHSVKHSPKLKIKCLQTSLSHFESHTFTVVLGCLQSLLTTKPEAGTGRGALLYSLQDQLLA